MRPLIPNRETFFGRPTRPSRLFIALFIVSAVVNAVLLVNFGYWESRLLIERQGWHNSLDLVQAQSDGYQEQLAAAQEDIALKDARLLDLDAKLVSTEKELASLNARIKAQESQLASNSTELQALRNRPPLFKFESTTSRDISTAKADVERVVRGAYEHILAVYGSPYILHQITISFVDQLSINGAVGEITIENSSSGISIQISITDFDITDPDDVDTIIHEIIHGWHGLATFDAPVTEEGITVAATDAVIARLRAAGLVPEYEPYIQITDSEAAILNKDMAAPPDDSSFYNLPADQVRQYYQLAGWSWRQLAAADSGFFTRFNELLYSEVANGRRPTPARVRELVTAATKTVNGQDTAGWLTGQLIFNPV